MENEKILKRDENGKPIVGSYEYGTIDERQKTLDKFKLEVLSTFERELDAFLSGMKNEDEVGINFDLAVYNIADHDNRFDASIHRSGGRNMALVNPKSMKDIVSEVEEESKDGMV